MFTDDLPNDPVNQVLDADKTNEDVNIDAAPLHFDDGGSESQDAVVADSMPNKKELNSDVLKNGAGNYCCTFFHNILIIWFHVLTIVALVHSLLY